MIYLWIVAMVCFLVSIYAAYQKGRKIGRKEATWLQKVSIRLMQALSGYPRPHLTVILITDDTGIGKGNRHEYPDCPEGFSLCVLLDDIIAEPKTGEEARDEIIKNKTQLEYLYKACHEFEELEKIIIKSKEISRQETIQIGGNTIKIIKNIIFLKVDTKN